MLSVLFYVQSLKWVLPASCLLGAAPNFLGIWYLWRILSLLMPGRFYIKGDDFLYSCYQRFVLFFFENVTGVEIILYGDAEEIMKKKENVIFISNHQCTVDWMIADMLAVRQGTIGHIRYILKDGLRYFPMYGFYFRMHSCIYVQRSGKFQQNKAEIQLQELVTHNVPFWMVIFPEGTRYTPEAQEKIEKGRKYAEDQGLPALDNLLFPRHKAFTLCSSNLREKMDAVYDVTIAYSNTVDKTSGQRISAPGLPEFLQCKSDQVHIHVKRISTTDLPRDEEKMKEWLFERFQEKDKLMNRFYSDDPKVAGTLGEDGIKHGLSLKETFPAFLFFSCVNAAMFGTEAGRSLYWKWALVGTVTGWMCMAVRA